jgi:hypothetical protein
MRLHFLAVSVCLFSCGQPPEPKPGSPTTIDAPAVSPLQESTTPEVAPVVDPEPSAPDAPVPAPLAAVPPPTEKPTRPDGVVAVSIGMHIGGGPNDAAAKAPFTKTIEGGFDEYVTCTGLVPAGERKGTFGIDLLIEKEGGKPQVSSPRTGLPGNAFKACIVGAFERLVFEKPKRGATKLSYSLRFD